VLAWQGSWMLVLVVGGCLWSRSFDVSLFRRRGARCCSSRRTGTDNRPNYSGKPP